MQAKALPGQVLVSDIQRGERMIGSIILPNDDGKQTGIRTRWAQVHSVGEGVTTVKEGEWILLEHGNWTRGCEFYDKNNEKYTVWKVNWPDGALAVSDTPTDTFAGESVVVADQLER